MGYIAGACCDVLLSGFWNFVQEYTKCKRLFVSLNLCWKTKCKPTLFYIFCWSAANVNAYTTRTSLFPAVKAFLFILGLLTATACPWQTINPCFSQAKTDVGFLSKLLVISPHVVFAVKCFQLLRTFHSNNITFSLNLLISIHFYQLENHSLSLLKDRQTHTGLQPSRLERAMKRRKHGEPDVWLSEVENDSITFLLQNLQQVSWFFSMWKIQPKHMLWLPRR